jgi:hypothetical protein|tara:strand:+ start:623 stop:841 length:219 start_codon:yes stop_codon:yes gene_type:complete
MSYIRKISIGANYKDAMHYLVGNSVMDGKYSIYEISQDNEGVYSVWIKKNNEVIKWKDFKRIPVTIEYNIDI